MSIRRLSARKITGIIVVVSIALLLLPEIIRQLAPQSGATVAIIWLFIATIAQLLGAFYLSVGIILGLWQRVVGVLSITWPESTKILASVIIAISVPAIATSILVAFGRRTGLAYMLSGFFVLTLPFVIGLFSTRFLDRRPIAIMSGLLYLGFILLYFAGIPIWPMTPTSGSILIDLVIPVVFLAAIYIVSSPLYVVGVRLRSITD